MTSSDHSAVPPHTLREPGCTRWSGLNIAAMVVGFVLFWPIGLVILGWIMSGRSVRELATLVREKSSAMMSSMAPFRADTSRSSDGGDNVVFAEYQQTQHDRIREIRDEITERAARFGEFRSAAKRRADKEEFDRFMSDTPVANGN